MIRTKFAARFAELQSELDDMEFEEGDFGDYAESGVWEKWVTSVESLIEAVCGVNSTHYKGFVRAREDCGGGRNDIQSLAGVFRSAKEAFEGGYLFDIERDVTAEVFGGFVVLAKRSLAEGNKDVAAVLASAALEDALKRHATLNGLDVDDATMSTVINALKSEGLVSGARKPMLTAMLHVRNRAMHAKWEEIEEPEVNGLIGFVEQFLSADFSGAR